MNLATKNLILSIIIVVMIIAACFTVKCIEPKNDFGNMPSFNITNNSGSNPSEQIIDNNTETEDKTIDESSDSKETTTDTETNKKDSFKNGRRERRNRDSNSGSKNRPSFNFDKDFKPNNARNSGNILYIILFGIESLVVGVCGTLLVLVNSKKLSKKVI